MSIDERVIKWLKSNDDLEIKTALDEYNKAWFGFMKAEPQTHNVKQMLKKYAILKRLFHTKTNTPYF